MQGSPISPYLFDTYIEELIEKIKNIGPLRDECVLMYADDHLAVICYNERKVKQVIRIIEEWSEINGLIVNKKKNGIMQVMGTKKQTTLKDDNISGIPVVKSYKYLGLHIDERLSVENHCNEMK